MEVFICTPTRKGRNKGEDQNKNHFKNQKYFYSNLSNNLNFPFFGGLLALILFSAIFFSAPRAHAADSLNNIELAKKVIKEVAPIVVEDIKIDETAVSLALEADDFIQKPLVVETKITIEPKVRAVDISVRTNGPHAFPYGYCTYYVSQKRPINWSGNAAAWLQGAKTAGLPTGENPQEGAIVVTAEGGRAGHVAYVEKVEGEKIVVSEMNFKGYGVISTRTLLASSKVIRGYIY